MMNGKQLNGLCKVLNVFQDEVRMDYNTLVDDAHVMMCVVEQSPMFGVDRAGGLDIWMMRRLRIENEDFEVFVEDDKYILRNDRREYRMGLVESGGFHEPRFPAMKLDGVIVTDARTLLKAAEKCCQVSDHCTLRNGVLSAEDDVTSISVKLGEDLDDAGHRSMFPLDYLRKVAKVMTGTVTIQYDDDMPMRMNWNDGYYDYTVGLAPRIEG